MDVSERIKKIQTIMKNGRFCPKHVTDEIARQMALLDCEVIEAIQTAAANGYDAGFNNRATWDAKNKEKQPVKNTQCIGCPDKNIRCHICVDG